MRSAEGLIVIIRSTIVISLIMSDECVLLTNGSWLKLSL